MTDESDNKVPATLAVAAEVVKAIPVYQDLMQPAARQVGTALETVAKTVNMALVPLSALVWGYDRIKEFVERRLSEKLKDVPVERIQSPSPHVAVPTLEALRYTGNEVQLREMYASLLATSMDTSVARSAHPAFVDIIKNMAPDEARILRYLAGQEHTGVVDIQVHSAEHSGYRVAKRNLSLIGAGASCEHQDLTESHLDNLLRLGLIEKPFGAYIAGDGKYEPLETCAVAIEIKETAKIKGDAVVFAKGAIALTGFGRQFCSACLPDVPPSIYSTPAPT